MTSIRLSCVAPFLRRGQHPQLPGLFVRQRGVCREDHGLDLPTEQVGNGPSRTAVGDVHEVHARVQLEKLHCQVLRRAIAW
nr:hypothetical protein [Pigmentiphaga sp.]